MLCAANKQPADAIVLCSRLPAHRLRRRDGRDWCERSRQQLNGMKSDNEAQPFRTILTRNSFEGNNLAGAAFA